ncbi:MAG: hypothetical protein QOE92_974 [Chloroflexota bacterium]|jgi:uncharacterized membrane protein YvbJ|nr:hypothetical protein [Chloroflexota bacterium]
MAAIVTARGADAASGNNLSGMAELMMYCWKCSFQHGESEITCPRCGAANAPGQSYATPPTVSSRRAHQLETEWTRTHQVGRHWPGAVSLGIVLVAFVVVGLVLSLVLPR